MLPPRTRRIFEELGWTEQWVKKGKLEGRLETACAMLSEGDSLEKISRGTGISRRTLKAKLAAQ
jgi:hypothetical protein